MTATLPNPPNPALPDLMPTTSPLARTIGSPDGSDWLSDQGYHSHFRLSADEDLAVHSLPQTMFLLALRVRDCRTGQPQARVESDVLDTLGEYFRRLTPLNPQAHRIAERIRAFTPPR